MSGHWVLITDNRRIFDYDALMAIRIEFFGIARQRAGVSELSLTAPQAEVPLGDVLHQIAERLPELRRELVINGRLHESLAANLGGVRFIRDPNTIIRDGQSLLILSSAITAVICTSMSALANRQAWICRPMFCGDFSAAAAWEHGCCSGKARRPWPHSPPRRRWPLSSARSSAAH
jgi:sulfur-carrier protein